MSGLLVISDIDSGFISADSIYLCLKCCKLLLRGNRPKCGIFNYLLCIEYQFYALVLVDLSLVKEAAITCAHPIVSIMKLKLSRGFDLAAYTYIKSHAIFLLQNLALLLNLLLSPTLELYNVIRIIWAGQERPTDSDL